MRAWSGQPPRPYAQHTINAGNDIRIDITSLDFDEALEAPVSMRYRIDNLTDRIVITQWTAIVGATEESTLTISAATNAMSTENKDRQLNQVTIEATYADGTKAKDTVVYQLCAVYEA
jgi:hypothetical protein